MYGNLPIFALRIFYIGSHRNLLPGSIDNRNNRNNRKE